LHKLNDSYDNAIIDILFACRRDSVTGFIKKLFGSKSNKVDAVEQAPPAPKATNGNAYYLDFDEARTFGNLEYMRTSKSVRRSFPKEKVGKDNASVRSVSAMEMQNGKVMPASQPAAPIAPKPIAKASEAGSDNNSSRRSSDSSMDMFRNMARDIRKG
jgi:hypothetical protein